MTLKLKTERMDDGTWMLIMLAPDGIWDILSDHETRAEALKAKVRETEAYYASRAAEFSERLLSAECVSEGLGE